MFKLWAVRVLDGNGREIYGDQYSDIWAINRLHYKGASPQVCDHVSRRCCEGRLPRYQSMLEGRCCVYETIRNTVVLTLRQADLT